MLSAGAQPGQTQPSGARAHAESTRPLGGRVRVRVRPRGRGRGYGARGTGHGVRGRADGSRVLGAVPRLPHEARLAAAAHRRARPVRPARRGHQEDRRPHPERPPPLRRLHQLRIIHLRQPVRLGHRAVKVRLAERQRVHRPHAAQQHRVRRPRAHSRQPQQPLPRRGVPLRLEPRQRQLPIQRRARHALHPAPLRLRHARHRRARQHRLRPGEGRHRLALHLHRVTGLEGDSPQQRRRLAHPQPLRHHPPPRRRVRRVEHHRPEARPPRRQPRQHRLPLHHPPERPRVLIHAQNPRHLRPQRLARRLAEGPPLNHPAVERQPDRRRREALVAREGQGDLPSHGARPRAGEEPAGERPDRLQRERTSRLQGERVRLHGGLQLVCVMKICIRTKSPTRQPEGAFRGPLLS